MGRRVAAQARCSLYDVDARNDPFLAEYERARDAVRGPDWERGLQELERLAHKGSLMSTLLVSDAMRTGWMYDQDLPGAEAWYQSAAASGSARGLFGLGLTYLVTDRFGEAIQSLEAAIAREFPPAYNALAGIYFRGDGVPADRSKALSLWRRGAALGHVPAKLNMTRQQIAGHYGLWGRVIGFLNILPAALGVVEAKASAPYSDRLR